MPDEQLDQLELLPLEERIAALTELERTLHATLEAAGTEAVQPGGQGDPGDRTDTPEA